MKKIKIMAAVVVAGCLILAACKKKATDDSGTLILGGMLLLAGSGGDGSVLTSTGGTAPVNAGQAVDPSVPVDGGSANLQANVPVAQQLSLQGGTPLNYTVALSDLPPSLTPRSGVVTDTTAQVNLNLVNSLGETVATVSSDPGATTVTLIFTPATDQTYTIIINANSPLLAEPTITGVTQVPDSQPQNVAEVLPSPTANIMISCFSVGGSVGSSYPGAKTIVGCMVGTVSDANGTVTGIAQMDAATVTVGSNTANLTYYADPFGDTTVSNPWNTWHIPVWYAEINAPHTTGETVTVALQNASLGINFNKSVVIPSPISAVTITQTSTGTQNLDGATNVTVSRSEDLTLAWTQPGTFPPASAGVWLSDGIGLGTIITGSGPAGSMIIAASTLSFLTTTNTDCQAISVPNFLSMNNANALDYYQGLVDTGIGGVAQVAFSGLITGAPSSASVEPGASEGYWNYPTNDTCTPKTGTGILTVN